MSEQNPYKNIQWAPSRPDADYTWIVEGDYPIRSTQQLSKPEVDYIQAQGARLFSRVLGAYVVVDGDELEIYWDIPHTDFERIRRITGYLVGTLDRFNDAKRAEESERVKHSTTKKKKKTTKTAKESK